MPVPSQDICNICGICMFVFQCFVASNLSCCYYSVLYGSALSAVPAIFFIMKYTSFLFYFYIVSAFMNNHATFSLCNVLPAVDCLISLAVTDFAVKMSETITCDLHFS